MLNIINESPVQFKKNVKDKRIVMYGGGITAGQYINSICAGLNILGIIDNDKKKWGTKYNINGNNYPIMSLKMFLEEFLNCKREQYVLFITPTYTGGEIINQLNSMEELSGITCYLGPLLRDWYEPQQFNFTEGIPQIPKKLHYIWMGKKELSDNVKKCIDSWHKYCPDYEIIRWDENNYDFTKCRYAKEAYECKRWGFVSDFARLDIVYKEGGIYLDTDVELLSSMDKLLCDEVFLSFSGDAIVNTGNGFGAIRKHRLIGELRDVYNEQVFINKNGELNLKACHQYQYPVLLKYGFKMDNIYQKRNGVVIYPSEMACPLGIMHVNNCFTENTIANHYGELSWLTKEQKRSLDEYRKILHEIINVKK